MDTSRYVRATHLGERFHRKPWTQLQRRAHVSHAVPLTVWSCRFALRHRRNVLLLKPLQAISAEGEGLAWLEAPPHSSPTSQVTRG